MESDDKSFWIMTTGAALMVFVLIYLNLYFSHNERMACMDVQKSTTIDLRCRG